MSTRFYNRLSQYIDDLQSKGKYVFSFEDMLDHCNRNENALRIAALRLIKKKRLVRLHHGLFSIVPIEYREVGSPPPSWFIDDLMKFLDRPYYVGILSAASMHGAAHQHPQEFQVITNKPLRPLKAGAYLIRFFTKSNLKNLFTSKINTETGFIRISTPEMTAIDLVRYFKNSGYLNNVATVLTELAEKIDPDKLLLAAQSGFELSVIQRLGYLLDRFSNVKITDPLWKWVNAKQIFDTPLRPDVRYEKSQKDQKWRVFVNDVIEADI